MENNELTAQQAYELTQKLTDDSVLRMILNSIRGVAEIGQTWERYYQRVYHWRNTASLTSELRSRGFEVDIDIDTIDDGSHHKDVITISWNNPNV